MEQDWHAKIRQAALEALSEAPRRSKILQKGLTVSKKDDKEVFFFGKIWYHGFYYSSTNRSWPEVLLINSYPM